MSVHVASFYSVESLGIAAAESAAAPPSLQDLLRVELQTWSWRSTLFLVVVWLIHVPVSPPFHRSRQIVDPVPSGRIFLEYGGWSTRG